MKYMNWFMEGLKFSCQGCGKCCLGPGGYVWVDEEEIDNFAKRLQMTKKAFMKKYIRNVKGRYSLIDNIHGDCIFMNKTGGCKYYEERPSQCRTFPWWPEIVGSREIWESNPYNCPGIGIGELHSEEKILEGLKDQ